MFETSITVWLYTVWHVLVPHSHFLFKRKKYAQSQKDYKGQSQQVHRWIDSSLLQEKPNINTLGQCPSRNRWTKPRPKLKKILEIQFPWTLETLTGQRQTWKKLAGKDLRTKTIKKNRRVSFVKVILTCRRNSDCWGLFASLRLQFLRQKVPI